MKQEIKIRIASTLIAIILSSGVCSIVYFAKMNNSSINSRLDKIDASTVKLEGLLLKKYNVNELLSKIEELTRKDLIKDQIIADQAEQIKEFGWMKKSMDKEGVNP